MKIWIDVKNSHEPLFFKSLTSNLSFAECYYTCRDFAEITDLLENNLIEFEIVGKRPEGNILKRIFGFVDRILKLLVRLPNFDFSINHWSVWSIFVSWLKNKPSIVLNDNDINPIDYSSIFSEMISYLISPKYIPKEYYISQGIPSDRIYQYNGFKEDIYIADYLPDKDFLNKIPFDDFVTIRAENSQALYYGNDKRTIVPELIRLFNKENIGVVFLPRYDSDKDLVTDFSGVYIPERGLNGLDLCHYSRAILTGAGTFSREAAIIGTCAVSFFNGPKLLSVDKEMIRKKMVFHSRNPDEILEHVLSFDKKVLDLEKSKKVKFEVQNLLVKLLKKEA